jgi:hypothetical protein
VPKDLALNDGACYSIPELVLVEVSKVLWFGDHQGLSSHLD